MVMRGRGGGVQKSFTRTDPIVGIYCSVIVLI